jgi:multidrug efflux pump subunit AcrA (membrane-fusion protein)
MSETQSETSLDFQPLVDNNTEDFEIMPLTSDVPVNRPPKKRRLWIIPIVVGLLILLVGGGVFAYIQVNRPPAVQYTQAKATVGNLAVTVSATGPVQPNAVYNLNFSASGTVQAINVHVGQTVKKGQVLATLNSTSLQDAINQAQASFNSAEQAVSSAQTNLSNTYAEQSSALNVAYDNEQNALNACSTSKAPSPRCTQLAQDQYAQAQNQAYAQETSASAQVNSAQSQLQSAQVQLQTAKDNLAQAKIVAPHAGTIASIDGSVGQAVAGTGSSTAFIVLLDSSKLGIAAQVNEANIGGVQVGQPATFTVAAYPSQTFRASVASIDTYGQTTSNVVTYTVTLAVDQNSIQNAHVYPGMTATVNITTAERIGTLLVPAAALSFSTTALENGELTRTDLRSLATSASSSTTTTGGTQSSRGIVVELKNGKLVPVLVTTGLSNGQFTEILSGLQAGDQIVVSQTGGTTTTSSTGTSTRSGFGGGFSGGGFSGGGSGGRGTGSGN